MPNKINSVIYDNIDNIEKYKKAADIHKKIRKYLNDSNIIKPGVKLIDICNIIEQKVIDMGGVVSFPTGTSINNIAAHYTPDINTDTVLLNDDVIKIDYGIHVDGYIIDSAFTYSNNQQFKPLIDASKNATYEAIKHSGVDARLCEIGDIIDETISSYELNINNNIFKIKPIYNLGGHSIEKYNLHGKKIIPLAYDETVTDKMEVGDVFAVETFATTGSGYAKESDLCSHFSKSDIKADLTFKKSKQLLNKINKEYKLIPFSSRQLNILSNDFSLKELITKKIVTPYPTLYDDIESYTSQLEHTIIIKDNGVINLSSGDDY